MTLCLVLARYILVYRRYLTVKGWAVVVVSLSKRSSPVLSTRIVALITSGVKERDFLSGFVRAGSEKYSGKIEGLDDNNWQSDSPISLREAARLARPRLARPRRGQRVTYHCKCKKGSLLAIRSGVSCHSKCMPSRQALQVWNILVTMCNNRPYKPNKSKEKHLFLQHLHSLELHQILVQLLSPIQHLGSLLRVSPLLHPYLYSPTTAVYTTTTIQSNTCTLVQSSQPTTSLVHDPRDTQPRIASFFNIRTHKTTLFVSSITHPNTSPVLKQATQPKQESLSTQATTVYHHSSRDPSQCLQAVCHLLSKTYQ